MIAAGAFKSAQLSASELEEEPEGAANRYIVSHRLLGPSFEYYYCLYDIWGAWGTRGKAGVRSA